MVLSETSRKKKAHNDSFNFSFFSAYGDNTTKGKTVMVGPHSPKILTRRMINRPVGLALGSSMNHCNDCESIVTHLVSDESISSTVSQAIRASFEVAPNFLEASMAALTASLESGRSKRLVEGRTLMVAGAKPWTAVTARAARERENFIVMVYYFIEVDLEETFELLIIISSEKTAICFFYKPDYWQMMMKCR